MIKADLHMHSRISDGSLTIEELLELADNIVLTHIAITDHDTTAHFSPSSEIFAKSSITLIRGLEISGFDHKRGRKAHILGYFIKDTEKAEKFLKPMVNKRQELSEYMVEKIMEAGYPITWDMVLKKAEGSTNVYKQHIMDVLISTGYSENLKGDLYKKLFKKCGIAYTEAEYPKASDCVKLIRECGGTAVLAHPMGYKNMELIPELIEYGLQGLEAYHPTHTQLDTEMVIKTAEYYDLLITGGSDFHGAYEGFINPLGSALTPEKDLFKLLEKSL